ADIWRLAPSDVFVLADPVGQVLAIHTNTPGITRSTAEELLKSSLGEDQPSFWWYGGGHLYQVFLQPIYFGAPKSGSILWELVVGDEISESLAAEVGRVASSQVAFFYGNKLIVSTMQPGQEADLTGLMARSEAPTSNPAEMKLADETFVTTTVELAPSVRPFVHLTVLKSYDKAAGFLDGLNRLLLVLALLAV